MARIVGMEIDFNAKFKKQYKKLPWEIRKKFLRRLDMFKENPYHPLLNTHKLRGKKRAFRSINITGDYRALFLWKGDVVIFHQIGTHSELY